MKMTLQRRIILVCLVSALLAVGWIGTQWWKQRQWFALQRQQLQTIQRIGDYPPRGWKPAAWKNALVTPYNVWGNVTYRPDYSEINIDEMQELQNQLTRILGETTSENSIQSVDRVFELLLKRGRKADFIIGYRDEFRTYRPDPQPKPN